jgi:hypothetical protein
MTSLGTKNVPTSADVYAGICFCIEGAYLTKNTLTATIACTGSGQIQLLGNLAINTERSHVHGFQLIVT